MKLKSGIVLLAFKTIIAFDPAVPRSGITQAVGRIIHVSGHDFYRPKSQLMQTLKHIANLVWKILLLEGVLLIVVAVLWRWTSWHTTTDYGFVLVTTGGIVILLGLAAVATRGSGNDMVMRAAKRNMSGSDLQAQHSSTSFYAESTRIWFWLISLGIITVAIGLLLGVLF
jgi:hypothetical protein